ncbi:PHP domain-containing protein [Myxococcota bacterium]
MVLMPVRSAVLARGEVDFHLHTTTSDGSYTGKQVVDFLMASGVGVAAITDHDSTAAIRDPALWRYLDTLGPAAPQIVPGVEITCSLKEPLVQGGLQALHIIGLGVNPKHPKLRKALMCQRLAQDARMRHCITELRADGHDIQYSRVGVAAGRRRANAWDMARLLVGQPGVSSKTKATKLIRSHLTDYRQPPVGSALDAGNVMSHPERFALEPEDAIALIHEAGGVAVLAHPHRNVPTHDEEVLRALFTNLKNKGLDAAEGYRHLLAEEHRPIYRRIMRETGLLISGGSDFHRFHHGDNDRCPGDADAPSSLWKSFEELIVRRGGLTDIRQMRVPIAPRANASERLHLNRAG